MFEYISYRKELSKLNKQKKELEIEYSNLEKSYVGQDDQGHLSFAGYDLLEFSKSIEYRQTLYFRSISDKMLIPMPDPMEQGMYSSFDFDDENGAVKILTAKGVYHLKTKIREEKKAKREIVAFWFSICTGLIGATIGLVSVLTK